MALTGAETRLPGLAPDTEQAGQRQDTSSRVTVSGSRVAIQPAPAPRLASTNPADAPPAAPRPLRPT